MYKSSVSTGFAKQIMFKKIKKPAACEMPSVIRFLNARKIKLPDIHHQLCDVCGEHAMSDSMVRRWMRYFNEGRKNVHDDLWNSRPSVVNEDLMRAVGEKIQENRRFTISSLSMRFPQISRSLLHGGIILRYRDTKTGAPLQPVPQQWWKLC
jgi:hypothetical protein